MNFEKKILELNLELPEAKAPVGNYVATKIIGKLLYISGQISTNEKGACLHVRSMSFLFKAVRCYVRQIDV